MGSREENTDNAKHGPTRTKAMASTPVEWPSSMGEWDAPAQKAWPLNDQTTEDDEIQRNAEKDGPIQFNPLSL